MSDQLRQPVPAADVSEFVQHHQPSPLVGPIACLGRHQQHGPQRTPSERRQGRFALAELHAAAHRQLP